MSEGQSPQSAQAPASTGGVGGCMIDVNSGARRLTVRRGEPLLRTLKKQGILLASACGGRGACGFCRCRVAPDAGPFTPAEMRLLTEAERGGGVRLGCQVLVRADLAVVVPQDALRAREFRGVVGRLRDLTYDIKELRIRLFEPHTIDFAPGQYVLLEAPPGGRRKIAIRRAYSMSSPPGDAGHIELIVRLVPGGICTTWVFTVLKEGDEVTFSGPYGEFRASDSDAEMVWIAGGSGMAPFWSLVRHMRDRAIARPVTYFFGAVRTQDLFLVDELNKLQEELPWFTFVPSLSGQDVGNWQGERGLITEVVGRRVANGAGKEAYLCGSPGMIDAAIKALKAKGFTDDRIFYDKFA